LEGLNTSSDPYDTDDELLDSFNSNVPSMPIPKPPPGSLLNDIGRPPSPTNICDFPYFNLKPSDSNYKLNPRSTWTLPKFSVTHANLHQIQQEIQLTEENIDEWDDDELRVSEIMSYSVIADVGKYGRTFKINKS
jgi:hypothetical protein